MAHDGWSNYSLLKKKITNKINNSFLFWLLKSANCRLQPKTTDSGGSNLLIVGCSLKQLIQVAAAQKIDSYGSNQLIAALQRDNKAYA
jgi:hypothetical protein